MRFGISFPLFDGIRGFASVRTPCRRPATYWTHPGCDIHHRTQGAAERCRYGHRA